MKQDTDYVISLINYYNEKGDDDDGTTSVSPTQNNKEKRIKVNDSTASGGWF